MKPIDNREQLEKAYAEWDNANDEVVSTQTVLMVIRPDDPAFSGVEDALVKALNRRCCAGERINAILQNAVSEFALEAIG